MATAKASTRNDWSGETNPQQPAIVGTHKHICYLQIDSAIPVVVGFSQLQVIALNLFARGLANPLQV